jgi:hypothetical protein
MPDPATLKRPLISGRPDYREYGIGKILSIRTKNTKDITGDEVCLELNQRYVALVTNLTQTFAEIHWFWRKDELLGDALKLQKLTAKGTEMV